MKIWVCLTIDIFTHGQLYVVNSFATGFENVSILLATRLGQHNNGTMGNVVYNKVL